MLQDEFENDPNDEFPFIAGVPIDFFDALESAQEKICYCNASNARDGHIHEKNGYVLCLHYEDEDGTNCPNRDKA